MQNSDIKDALVKTKLYESLESPELDILIAHSKIITFSPGDIILQQGKINENLYIILEGNAVVSAKRLGKGVINIMALQEGNLLGEISSTEKGPSHTSVIATSKVQCLLITKTYIDTLSLFFPESKYKIARMIAKEICNRLVNVHQKITHFMTDADMVTRSRFGAVIKSLTKPEPISFADAEIDTQQLKKSPFFSVFTSEEYEILLKHSKLIKTAKQCNLIHEGEKNPSCYIILFGAVQSSIVHDNKIAKITVQGPMTIIGNISVVDKNLASLINYATCERAILLTMTESDISLLQKNNIQLWYKVFDLICESFAILERSTEKLDIRLNSELYNR